MSNGRPPIRRAFASWLLLVLFLVGTATPALSRMTCLQSGHSEVSVGYAKDCCPEEAPTQGATLKPVCCEVLTAKPEKHPFASNAPVVVPVPVIDASALPLLPDGGVHRSVKPCREWTSCPTGARLAAIGAFRI